MKISLFLLCSVVIFSSCAKMTNDCGERTYTITSNSPVAAGENIQLSVDGGEDVALYNWYGPNHFTSHETNPEILNASGFDAGEYTLDIITKSGCVYKQSHTVTVGNSTAACNPGTNGGELDGVASISFYSVNSYPTGSSYTIEGNGMNGDMELEFAGASQPVAGVYQIRSIVGDFYRGDVRIRMVSSNSLWNSHSGNVYVSVNQGKVTATFCDVEFSSPTFYFNTTGSMSITED